MAFILSTSIFSFENYYSYSFSSDKASTSNMKIDTLNFLNCLLISHDDKLFHPYLDALIPVNHPLSLSFT